MRVRNLKYWLAYLFRKSYRDPLIKNMFCWNCIHCTSRWGARPYCELLQDIPDPMEKYNNCQVKRK